VLSHGEDRACRRAAELVALLEEFSSGTLRDARWPAWQEAARAWAELDLPRHGASSRLEEGQQETALRLQPELDSAFQGWLRRSYSALGGRRLPEPHHLHHVPHYLAYRRRTGAADRVALLVLDGLSLADWLLVGPTWRVRHPEWRLEERMLLAQIPTLTAVSRQALVSGRRPADFTATLGDSGAEPRHWAAFWSAEGLPAEACRHLLLAPHRGQGVPDDPGAWALCLVYGGVDGLLHGATLGAEEVRASLRVWLEQESPEVEAAVEDLLRRGFAVYLASDHGHIEARGVGQPSEGVLVRTRSKRARVYGERSRAQSAQQSFAETVLWGGDGLLPEGVWALMPSGREAFAPFGERVVTRGGITLEEMVVPLVEISRTR
jgi:hypothetical protein